jgi:hypothetical protein
VFEAERPHTGMEHAAVDGWDAGEPGRGALAELRERAVLSHVEPSPGELDEQALARFLRARQQSVDAALEMWENWVVWRREMAVDAIKEDDVRNELESQKALWHGRDRMGRPCLVIRPRYHDPSRRNLEEFKRFAVFIMEQGCRLADESGTGQVVRASPAHCLLWLSECVYAQCIIYDRSGELPSRDAAQLMQCIRRNGSAQRRPAAARDAWRNQQCTPSLLRRETRSFLCAARELVLLDDIPGACTNLARIRSSAECRAQVVKPFLSRATIDKINILGSYADLSEYFEVDSLLPEMR